MEENSIISNVSEDITNEPTNVDNSNEVYETSTPDIVLEEGQSSDPSEGLMLGKFKTVEDLLKAYSELQRCQGQNSQELGDLRRESQAVSEFKEGLEELISLQNSVSETLVADREKYNQPEYFQEPTFRDLYKEAFIALNGNLDTDRFVNLLESYVNSRVNAYEKSKSAQYETQQVLESMNYEKNSKTSFTPPKKTFDEMSPQEVDELLERLI